MCQVSPREDADFLQSPNSPFVEGVDNPMSPPQGVESAPEGGNSTPKGGDSTPSSSDLTSNSTPKGVDLTPQGGESPKSDLGVCI